MISLKSRPKTHGGALSANITTLSVSWLGKQFRAAAIHHGQVVGTWQAPEPIEGTNHFADLIRRAAAETGYRGVAVSLVLAHARLVHQLIEVPPVKGQALTKVLHRQAQQQSQSLFPAEPVWSAQPAESGKGNQRFLLNLFPKPLLDDLTNGATKGELFLTAVLPTTAVLQHQLLELPSQNQQVVMIAAETGDTTTVLVGRSDGRILLARTLSGNWNEGLERMAVDLKRTVLFVNQQHGINVTAVYLFGRGAATQLKAVQAQVGLPVQLSPAEFTEDYWITESLRLQAGGEQNLISRAQQMAPRRRLLARVAAGATLALVVAALLCSAWLTRLRLREQENLVALRSQSAKLQVQHRDLQALHEDLSRRKDLIRVVADGRVPRVAGWMLGYLSEAVPRELVVTNLSVRKEDSLWRLRLSGQAQPGVAGGSNAALATAFTTLTNRLATGPFHVRFFDAAQAEKLPAPKAGASPAALSAWLAKLGTAPPVKVSAEASFFLEGMMQP